VDAVAADAALMAPMVEESIRYLSPVQGLFRNTLSDAELGGVTIPADSKVFLCYASANRDTDQWPDADQFRLDRYPDAPNDADHVAFAPGIHLCLGAHLPAWRRRSYTKLIERTPPRGHRPDHPRHQSVDPRYQGTSHVGHPPVTDRPVRRGAPWAWT
jgi:cytochrome P450